MNVSLTVELPYQVYKFLISQSGGGDPTVKVLQNTIGDIVWTRITSQPGNYLGTLAGAFTEGKTWFMIQETVSTSRKFSMTIEDENTIKLVTSIFDGDFIDEDEDLQDTPGLIEVYP